MLNPEQKACMQAVGSVFLWCFLFTIILMLFWFGMILLVGDWAYEIHSQWFELTRREFDLLNYYGMAFVKTVNFLFFFIPFLAIRVVTRGK